MMAHPAACKAFAVLAAMEFTIFLKGKREFAVLVICLNASEKRFSTVSIPHPPHNSQLYHYPHFVYPQLGHMWHPS
jgi:hypothetical protein